ncbi:MAG TPA: efflux transporter outer membrane subunit [Candidatus Acidoferrales bacterium]|nr:efflux transporter outer membrane subunit [Candidatus Acidoferrales bacterium]
MGFRSRQLAGLLCTALLVSGCNLAPQYHAPSVQRPDAYKELTPADFPNTDGWKVAQPSDSVIRNNWWEMFNDPELNKLEEQVNVSNQSIAAAVASFYASRAIVREERSALFPTLGAGLSITESRQISTRGATTTTTGGTASSSNGAFTGTLYSLPFDASYVPDLWGRVRNTVRAQIAAAQVSAADLANVRLTEQADLAVDYFDLRTQDALKQLLDSTVVAYRESLRLETVLFETGIASDEAVAQAETQLETAEAQDTSIGIARSQFEHAIALLVGQPASTFSIPAEALNAPPIAIPFGVPSQLLERRPDIAASERSVAQANAQIGVARAAFYPTVTLGASAGFESPSITDWFTWPSRVWSVGPSVAETIFEGGLRRATVQQFQAQYDVTVANYRETVLTAFQQVENNLSTLRILSQEIQQQDTAVKSAERSLSLATDRYRLGIDPYLNVITAQTTLLTSQQTDVNLRLQQMTASVQLIEALGGGWDATQLPSAGALVTGAAQPLPRANP